MATPPIVIAETAANDVPLIVVTSPRLPLVAESAVTVGTSMRVMFPVAVPPGAVTTMSCAPNGAELGTVPVIVVEFTTVNVDNAVPPMVTLDASVKYEPLIVIAVFRGAVDGLALVIVGTPAVIMTLFDESVPFNVVNTTD